MNEYLTAKELAQFLRIKERKVYQLATSGEIPCSRAMGKLLFPRRAVEDWVARGAKGRDEDQAPKRPGVVLGSHDPLLEWALRESRSGLATYFDGSLDGLRRFAAGEGIATGLHVFDPKSGEWNTPLIGERFKFERAVMVEWAWRSRGLIVAPEEEGRIRAIEDLKGRRIVPRQVEAGSQALLLHLLSECGLSPAELDFSEPARTEAEAALAVLEGKANAAFGLETLARQFRLTFVPIIRERFDLLVDRRAWFEPAMQSFLAFCRTKAFSRRLKETAGYEADGLGTVHFNGA